MTDMIKGLDPLSGSGDWCLLAVVLWGSPTNLRMLSYGHLKHYKYTPRQFKHILSKANVFTMKTSVLLSHVTLTCTCCLCVFSILGSIDNGPRTLTISSFSTSHCFNWASTVWNWVRLLEDSSSFCCLSTVSWLSSCHLESKRKR